MELSTRSIVDSLKKHMQNLPQIKGDSLFKKEYKRTDDKRSSSRNKDRSNSSRKSDHDSNPISIFLTFRI
jgi:hypothetical protein